MQQNKTQHLIIDSFGNKLETKCTNVKMVSEYLTKNSIKWSLRNVKSVPFINSKGKVRQFYPTGYLIDLKKHFVIDTNKTNVESIINDPRYSQYDDLLIIIPYQAENIDKLGLDYKPRYERQRKYELINKK